MHRCSVLGCKNEGNHSFPKDENTRKQWEVATRRKGFQAKKNSKMCSAHFTSDDYIKIGWYSGLTNTRKILKKGSVPSVFQLIKPEDIKAEQRRKRATARDIYRKLCVSFNQCDRDLTPKPPAKKNKSNTKSVHNLKMDEHKSKHNLLDPNSIKSTLEDRRTSKGKEDIVREPLTTKNAVTFLLNGCLKSKVCRFCLNMSSPLSELDQIMNVAGSGGLYKVTIRTMIATVHPFKVSKDPNFPDKICQQCIDRAINAYLLAQQCERAERALFNCFEDMYDKIQKLDPIVATKRRGRQKKNPNYNKLQAEHMRVIDYADPIINMINLGSESFINKQELNPNECKKCFKVLPNIESLFSHEKTHPKTMWYNCRLCGKSFPKLIQLRKHHKQIHILGNDEKILEKPFTCKQCFNVAENHVEHLQHMEKHKFKHLMKNVLEKRFSLLCSICLDEGTKMANLEDMVCLNGGHTDVMGDKTLYNVLAATLPDIHHIKDFIGTKICDKCLKNALTSYIFLHQFNFTRERLDMCVSYMLQKLTYLQPEANVFITIDSETIMPKFENYDENLLLDDNEVLDMDKLTIDILEDEFRLPTESESENEMKNQLDTIVKEKEIENENSYKIKINCVQSGKCAIDVCSEFLTFKKKKTKRAIVKLTCPLCRKHFTSEYFLKKHILKHVNTKVKCKICEREFKSKFYLYEHTKMVHLLKLNKYISCRVCGRNFCEENKLILHAKHHRRIACQLCDKVFSSQKHFDSHIPRHISKLKLLNQKHAKTCSFCEKQYSNDNELSLHVNKIHLKLKPYNCDMCEHQFYTAKNLRSHRKVHSMYSKEDCMFCGLKFKCRKHLVSHVRKHIEVNPFGCQACGTSFDTDLKVKEHMKVAHGGDFCCGICKVTFDTMDNLREHVAWHNSV